MLACSAFDRGALGNHGDMLVTSWVHRGPEGGKLEVGTPLGANLGLHRTATDTPDSTRFLRPRRTAKSDASSSSKWRDHHEEGMRSVRKGDRLLEKKTRVRKIIFGLMHAPEKRGSPKPPGSPVPPVSPISPTSPKVLATAAGVRLRSYPDTIHTVIL